MTAANAMARPQGDSGARRRSGRNRRWRCAQRVERDAASRILRPVSVRSDERRPTNAHTGSTSTSQPPNTLPAPPASHAIRSPPKNARSIHGPTTAEAATATGSTASAISETKRDPDDARVSAGATATRTRRRESAAGISTKPAITDGTARCTKARSPARPGSRARRWAGSPSTRSASSVADARRARRTRS